MPTFDEFVNNSSAAGALSAADQLLVQQSGVSKETDLGAVADFVTADQQSALDGRYAPIEKAQVSEAASAAANLAALQAAATSAASAGRALFIPPGTFDISGTWTISSWDGMRVFGAGHLVTTINNTATDGSPAIEIDNNAKDWSLAFEDFTVTGNASSGDGFVVGTSGTYGGPVTLRRVGFIDNGGDGFASGASIDQLLLDSCVARGNGGFGYNLTGTFISETTMLNCHGNTNTSGGVTLGSTVRIVNMIGCEFGNNDDVDVVIGASEQVNMVGCYFESGGTNTHAFINKTGALNLAAVGCSFTDLSTSGQPNLVVLASGRCTFDSCTFAEKASGAGVYESGGASVQVTYRACRTSGLGNLRRLADSSTTNVVNGGPTTYRPSTHAAIGDNYYDTTIGVLMRYAGSSTWVPVEDRGFKVAAGAYVTSRHATKTTRSVTTGTCYFSPLEWPGGSVDRIGTDVTSAGTAGAVVRLGIYTDVNGKPGALVLDAGTIDATSTGAAEITISQALTSGRYWLAAAAQTAGCTLRGFTGQLDRPISFDGLAFAVGTSVVSGFSAGSVTGALPSSAPAVSEVGSAPIVAVRAA